MNERKMMAEFRAIKKRMDELEIGLRDMNMPESEFQKGELVQARDMDNHPWSCPVYFLDHIPQDEYEFKTADRADLQDSSSWRQCRKYIPDDQFWVDIVDGQRPKYEGLALWDDDNIEGSTRRASNFAWPWQDCKRFLPLDMAEYKRSIGRED